MNLFHLQLPPASTAAGDKGRRQTKRRKAARKMKMRTRRTRTKMMGKVMKNPHRLRKPGNHKRIRNRFQGPQIHPKCASHYIV